MFIFFRSLLSAVVAFLTIALPSDTKLPERKCAPEFNGTFIQSWMSSTWDAERWADEVEVMQKDGIKYLILQDIANMDTAGAWTVYYDSTIDDFAAASKPCDVVEAALEAVKGTDIQIFVGLTMFDAFWTTGTLDGKYTEVCNVTAKMLEDIYNIYYSEYKDNFYGWYFTMELNNILNCQLGMTRAVKGLNAVLNKATQVDEGLPVMMSPFTSEYLAFGKITALSQWVKLFTQGAWRDGDIIAPQDAVGAAWIKEDDLVKIWQMYSVAISYAEADLKLWANCENFTLAIADGIGAGWLLRPASENIVSVPATLDRFTKQMNIASRYCENIITFSHTHYYSENEVSSAFIETYRDYVANGYVLESESPVMGDFAKAQGEEGVELSWAQAEDNIGISHYRIEKNGEFLWRAETYDGYHRVSYTDENGTTDDVYTIVAYDAAGNASETVVAK
ncbi:MAG: DUF4434 domain-containing protein [Clostridia bacterium]|nr:DUF4434 domain-containing protein [Clostridia bacterium]